MTGESTEGAPPLSELRELAEKYRSAAGAARRAESDFAEAVRKNNNSTVDRLSLELNLSREFVEHLLGSSHEQSRLQTSVGVEVEQRLTAMQKIIMGLRRDNAVLRDALLLLSRELDRGIEGSPPD